MRRQRVTVVFAALVIGLALVELRLVKLQLLQGEMWERESRRSTMQFETVPAERGWILDRHGEPLAKTEEVRELDFHFREWRRSSGLGQAAALAWLLDGQRRTAREAWESADDWLDGLGAVRVEELGALQPKQRARDALTYVTWLYGKAVGREARELLADEPVDPAIALSDLQGFAEGLAEAHRRLEAERGALADLARVSGLGLAALWAGVDEVVEGIDRRVAKVLEADGAPDDPFGRARELHAEFDGDAQSLADGISYDCQTLAAVREHELAGFEVQAKRRRVYPPGVADVAARLIGRVGLPRPADTEQATADRVRLSDLSSLDDLSAEELVEYEQLRIRVREIDYASTEDRGRLGLESALETQLRGKRGWIAAVRDPQGNIDGEVESAPPQRGLNVTLSLDLELQRACEQVLQRVLDGRLHGRGEGWPGAIVLLDPQTGQVLALASAPMPTRQQLEKGYGALEQDALGPLYDRCLGPGSTKNLPPPGSTFKPFAALAALEAGTVSPGQSFECDGQITVGGQTLGCLSHHGRLSLQEAVARSCNLYFYQLADATGGGALHAMALAAGFGSPTHLLRGNAALEALGIRPENGVVEKNVPLPAQDFHRVDAMRLAIGQAPLDDVTPLQVAVAFGALGTGIVQPPTLIAAVEGYGPVPPGPGQPLPASEEHLATVRAAMAAVVDLPGGTASRLRSLVGGELASRIAGKTGTPEVEGKPDHSWFAGYMPRDQPRVAFAILLEHTGEHGGDACVPVLAELLACPALRDLVLPGETP